ncbi:hypothetical protein K438DRAFT_1783793 [Mycena galopus ATCC 62051]|nr:hypothetical protein K438DRAFT_1783793 [Mycena galopus ATCC 62051]
MFLEMMSCFGFTPRWLDLPSGGAGRTVFLRVGRNGRWGRYGGSSGGARCLVHGVVPWNTHDRILGGLQCANAFEDALSWTILSIAGVALVAYLLVLETLNMGFDMQIMYQPLILKYNQVLDYFPIVFVSEPLCVVLVSTPTQLFFTWLICTFTCVRAAPVLIALFAGAAFGESSLVVVYQFFGGRRRGVEHGDGQGGGGVQVCREQAQGGATTSFARTACGYCGLAMRNAHRVPLFYSRSDTRTRHPFDADATRHGAGWTECRAEPRQWGAVYCPRSRHEKRVATRRAVVTGTCGVWVLGAVGWCIDFGDLRDLGFGIWARVLSSFVRGGVHRVASAASKSMFSAGEFRMALRLSGCCATRVSFSQCHEQPSKRAGRGGGEWHVVGGVLARLIQNEPYIQKFLIKKKLPSFKYDNQLLQEQEGLWTFKRQTVLRELRPRLQRTLERSPRRHRTPRRSSRPDQSIAYLADPVTGQRFEVEDDENISESAARPWAPQARGNSTDVEGTPSTTSSLGDDLPLSGEALVSALATDLSSVPLTPHQLDKLSNFRNMFSMSREALLSTTGLVAGQRSEIVGLAGRVTTLRDEVSLRIDELSDAVVGASFRLESTLENNLRVLRATGATEVELKALAETVRQHHAQPIAPARMPLEVMGGLASPTNLGNAASAINTAMPPMQPHESIDDFHHRGTNAFTRKLKAAASFDGHGGSAQRYGAPPTVAPNPDNISDTGHSGRDTLRAPPVKST